MLGRSPGEGNGNPFQYSCRKHSKDRGDWQATEHGAAKSQIRLSTCVCACPPPPTHTQLNVSIDITTRQKYLAFSPNGRKKKSLLTCYWSLSGLVLSFLLFSAISCLKWLNKVNHFVLVYELYVTILFVAEMSSGK